MRNLVALLSGFLFAVGLGVSGMTQPMRIIGFLDFTNGWDPTLAIVMVGALGVYGTAWFFARARQTSLLGEAMQIPPGSPVDARLVGGAAVFGLGWGLGGYCPGPAVVATASGTGTIAVFVVAMLAGSGVAALFPRR